MKRLDGRVAVVTGAGSGIGRATALALAERGCRLALVDLNAEGIAESAALAVSASPGGPEPSLHTADVSDEAAVAALPDEVVQAHGAVHVLVNNAGVATAGRFDADDLDLARWIVGINVWGVLHGCHAFLPQLRQADEAHIVNVSSMAAFVGLPQNAVYSMTKGAVRTFSEGLRGELAGAGIGVTTVFPGAINTNIMASSRGAESERLASMANSRLAPLVLQKPEKVARKLVRGIEANRSRVVVGPDAHLLQLASRIAPGRSALLGKVLDRVT